MTKMVCRFLPLSAFEQTPALAREWAQRAGSVLGCCIGKDTGCSDLADCGVMMMMMMMMMMMTMTMTMTMTMSVTAHGG